MYITYTTSIIYRCSSTCRGRRWVNERVVQSNFHSLYARVVSTMYMLLPHESCKLLVKEPGKWFYNLDTHVLGSMGKSLLILTPGSIFFQNMLKGNPIISNQSVRRDALHLSLFRGLFLCTRGKNTQVLVYSLKSRKPLPLFNEHVP